MNKIAPMKTRTQLQSLSVTLVATLTTLLASGAAEPQPKKDLPQVLIIGDSISIGYTPQVKQMLQGEAIVTHNKGNAGPTGNGLQNIEA